MKEKIKKSNNGQGMLRRYTNLTAALSLIESKRIKLSNPKYWDDKNDRRCMETFAEYKGYNTCLALCFCIHRDTYHHWKIYSPEPAGVCVEFKKELLTAAADKEESIIHDKIEYYSIMRLRAEKNNPELLPFMKRSAFKDESEYRFVYGSKKENEEKWINIEYFMINRIIANPWMLSDQFEHIREAMKKITNNQIIVERSQLLDHVEWNEFIEKCKIY